MRVRFQCWVVNIKHTYTGSIYTQLSTSHVKYTEGSKVTTPLR